MRVLISGSWRQHNTVNCDRAMFAAKLLGIEPTQILTGCWVGADQLGISYAKANTIPSKTIDLHRGKLPDDIDAVILLSHRGEIEERWIIDSCELLGIECVVW